MSCDEVCEQSLDKTRGEVVPLRCGNGLAHLGGSQNQVCKPTFGTSTELGVVYMIEYICQAPPMA